MFNIRGIFLILLVANIPGNRSGFLTVVQDCLTQFGHVITPSVEREINNYEPWWSKTSRKVQFDQVIKPGKSLSELVDEFQLSHLTQAIDDLEDRIQGNFTFPYFTLSHSLSVCSISNFSAKTLPSINYVPRHRQSLQDFTRIWKNLLKIRQLFKFLAEETITRAGRLESVMETTSNNIKGAATKLVEVTNRSTQLISQAIDKLEDSKVNLKNMNKELSDVDADIVELKNKLQAQRETGQRSCHVNNAAISVNIFLEKVKEARKHIIIELALITDWSSKLVQFYDEMETAQEYFNRIEHIDIVDFIEFDKGIVKDLIVDLKGASDRYKNYKPSRDFSDIIKDA